MPRSQRADSSAVWNIVIEHLPQLQKAVDQLIAAANEREPP